MRQILQRPPSNIQQPAQVSQEVQQRPGKEHVVAEDVPFTPVTSKSPHSTRPVRAQPQDEGVPVGSGVFEALANSEETPQEIVNATPVDKVPVPDNRPVTHAKQNQNTTKGVLPQQGAKNGKGNGAQKQSKSTKSGKQPHG